MDIGDTAVELKGKAKKVEKKERKLSAGKITNLAYRSWYWDIYEGT